MKETAYKIDDNTLEEKDIVIYGLSTEGYEIAKKILQYQPKVIIIDENSRLGIILTSEIVKEYPNITLLMNEELLLNLKPFDQAISNATMIFFAPRIRKINQDVKNEIILKFKEIITHIRTNTVVIINIPMGIGGNNEIITLIEHQSGLIVGTDIIYYYNPINRNKNLEVNLGEYNNGKKENPFLKNIIYLVNKNDQSQGVYGISSITSSELLYSMTIINKYSNLISINEISRLNRSTEIRKEIFNNKIKPVFFDEITNGLFDLRIISSSLSGTPALGYIVNGIIKAIEGFIKSLVEEIRNQLKSREIKASRTKVTILWTIDNHEIRGDKTIIRELLEAKLRDYIAEVEIQDIESFIPATINNIIVACSSYDYEKSMYLINKNLNHHNPNYKTVLVAANSSFDTVAI